MSDKAPGITHVYIPVALYGLGLTSVAELSILALAVAFGEQGLTETTSGLGRALRINRSNICRAVRRLRLRGHVVYEAMPRGRRQITASSVIMTLCQSDTCVTSATPPVSDRQQRCVTCATPILSKELKGKRKARTAPRPIPQNVDEVEQYATGSGHPIDAGAFFDHFASNGWKVGGKTPMVDWQAAVRQWHRRDVAAGKSREPSYQTHEATPKEIEALRAEGIIA